ncbi:protein of unknown function [Clostridium beijerinckii]|nr:protein of unknown function [Clostridium beijerinckii]
MNNLRVEFPLESSLVILKYTISNLPRNKKKNVVDLFYTNLATYPNIVVYRFFHNYKTIKI